MRLRQLMYEASAILNDSSDENLRELGAAMATLADNGSGDDIHTFLGAIRPLAEYAQQAGV